MKELSIIDGHIILYCKGHYSCNISFLTGLRRIWGIRCGLSEEHINKSIDRYIANHLYDILKIINPKKVEYLHEIIHENLDNKIRYEDDLSSIEKLILIYKSE